MFTPAEQLIVIGGSAGSLPVIMSVVEALPHSFTVPVVIVLHRLRNVNSALEKILTGLQQHLRVCEPEDKEAIRHRHIYLAPQNYHLLIEADKTFSLDYSEPVHFSRPSIDVTFESAARVFSSRLTALLLSGANEDGAAGIKSVSRAGGRVAVQDPDSCEYPAMPLAALSKTKEVLILQPAGIALFLENLSPDK